MRRHKMFLAAYIAIAALSLWLRIAVPVFAIGNARHDDLLFVRLAYQLGAGTWLGPYDNLTLAKGMAYPAFILASFLASLPLKIAEQAAYLAATGLMAWLMTRLTGRRCLALLLFACLAFNPVLWTAPLARVIREGLYVSLPLALIVLAAAVLLQRGVTRLILLITVGLVGGVYWLTREEGIWIAPALAVSAAARELRPTFEGETGEFWRRIGCDQTRTNPCPEILSGWFIWAFRDAVAAAGHYTSGRDAMAFYRRLAAEINAACDDHRIPCLPRRAVLAPPFRRHYLGEALAASSALYRVLTHVGAESVGAPISGVTAGHAIDVAELTVLISRVVMRGDPPGIPVAREILHSRQLVVMRGIAHLYQALVPILTLLAGLGVLVAVILRRYRPLPDGVIVLALVCATAVATRIALLAYLEVTSFPATHLLYLAPATPFLLTFVVLGLYLTTLVLVETYNIWREWRLTCSVQPMC